MHPSLESSPTTANDADLLAAFAASGDDPAFAELVRRHLPLVLAVTRRRLGGSGLAEDAAQQVFIALSRRVRQLKNIPCLPAWLQRAAVLESSRLARGESRHRQRAVAAQGLHNGPAVDAGARELDSALAALPEKDRQILLLHHFEKLAYEQIARRLGITPEAAQRRGHRALEKLRGLLQRQGHSHSGEACAMWLAGGLAPATTRIPKDFVTQTAALKKTATGTLPWLPLAAVVVLGGGTWAAVEANRPPPPSPSPPPLATAPSAERSVSHRRAPKTPDDKLSPAIHEFISLAKKDPKAAWEWVKEHQEWKEFFRTAVPALADRDPAAAEGFLEILTGREVRVKVIGGIFNSRADANFDTAVAWIDSFPESYERLAIIHGNHSYINSEWLDHDYAGALKFTHSPEIRHWLIREACEKYAAVNEPEIEALGRRLQGDDRRQALGWAASLLLQRDDPRGYELLDEVKPDDLPNGDELAKRDPKALLDWAARQTDGLDRYSMMFGIWNCWGQRDAAAAAAWGLEYNRRSKDRPFSPFDPAVERLMKQP
ncbi:sigma-70 family RNA polymerase sigma factor [Haloferula sp. BvORR071]|uniref:RNA polymerase sigma factor n=1 Tax=Haloferula sp. BvORR071 TaxID=1396141 RepID=UPI000552B26F|nr:sigma-70 family RNA polymerase sigma factor [Haloferula sp. BvORR071]